MDPQRLREEQIEFERRMKKKEQDIALLLQEKEEEERHRREAAERQLLEEQRRMEERLRYEAERQKQEREALERERERQRAEELARLAEKARLDKLREQQFVEEQRRILAAIEAERAAKLEAEERQRREAEERQRQITLIAAQKREQERQIQREYEENMQRQKEKFEREREEEKAAHLRKMTVVNPPAPPARVGRLPIPDSVSRKVTLDDFDFLSVLGRGAFGKVMLAQEKTTRNFYAMKALKKEFILQNDDVRSVKLEKRIFQAASASRHPFMVNLHSAFQTEARVYFVMEYVSGGDLMCHIQDKKRFSQVRTKFYACEYNSDLKLDNILMGPDGHIKVADYGICKENMAYGAMTRTYCGTPDYMAPEILSQSKYGRAVDWWSYGVLIYVMLIGRYPFHGEDEGDILDAIMSDTIEYPSNMPKDTLTLLQGLLKRDPTRRLGGGRLDAEEVKRHPYFAGVDWDAFMRKEVPPPWKPTIKSPTDVSNFDAEFTKERAVLTPLNSVLGAVHQAEFDDFDYVAEWVIDSRARAALAKS
ncbi:Serine/threonine kinase [Cladochytrium tenue]|nr:Serine/threonine kinase [Cladochytrium tenue]